MALRIGEWSYVPSSVCSAFHQLNREKKALFIIYRNLQGKSDFSVKRKQMQIYIFKAISYDVH